MSEHHATIEWNRTSDDFGYATYNREHTWKFEGGESVRASAAPGYKGDPSCVDPEEAFVASLSACHMLTFLALCTKKKLVVDSYVDAAIGHLEKTEAGRLAITKVVLRPRIEFGEGGAPAQGVLDELHHKAHELCFIANSVKTEIAVEAPAAV
jgi:organic hydroperoxide reductase OsmC/OhrA